MKKSPGLNWGLILALVFSFAFWYGVLNAQMVNLPATGEVEVAREDRTITWGWLDDNVMGFTICLDKTPDGRPMTHGVTFVLAGQSEIDRLDTEAHEAVHRAQYQRFGSCDAFEEYASTPRGHLLVEAEAYSTGACVSVHHGMDRESVEKDYAERIAYGVMDGSIPPIRIVPIIQFYEHKICPEIFPPAQVSSVYSYPVMGYAVFIQGTLLAGHGWV